MHRLSSLALATVFAVQVLAASVHSRDSDPPVVGINGVWVGGICYNDTVSARALPNLVVDGNITMNSCVTACHALNYPLAGVEYGSECWCGSELDNDSQPYNATASAQNCNMPCEGDSSEICGGPNCLNLYFYIETTVAPTS